MRIGIDIDGVLYPFEQAASEALMAEFDIPHPGPWTSWGYLKGTITPDQWAWLWTAEGTDAACGRVELTYPGVVEAINWILYPGEHEVHFVTHRDPRRTAHLTGAYLARHFGGHPWAGVHVIQNRVAKRTLARWDVFIDDKPDTVFDFLANTDTVVFAPVRPWNVDELGDVRDGSFVYYNDPRTIAEWVRSA